MSDKNILDGIRTIYLPNWTNKEGYVTWFFVRFPNGLLAKSYCKISNFASGLDCLCAIMYKKPLVSQNLDWEQRKKVACTAQTKKCTLARLLLESDWLLLYSSHFCREKRKQRMFLFFWKTFFLSQYFDMNLLFHYLVRLGQIFLG